MTLEEIQWLIDELKASLDNEASAFVGDIKSVQGKLNHLHNQENMKWQQRAKKHWVRKGDCNNHFFHVCPNHRWKKNTISKIKIENNMILEEETEIAINF